jgi:hypothetical protein
MFNSLSNVLSAGDPEMGPQMGNLFIPRSLTDENGYWHANWGNARLSDGSLFDYSASGDEVVIKVQGGKGHHIDTANDAPAPDMILDESNEPTSITVRRLNATSPSASLLPTALAFLALTLLAGVVIVRHGL